MDKRDFRKLEQWERKAFDNKQAALAAIPELEGAILFFAASYGVIGKVGKDLKLYRAAAERRKLPAPNRVKAPNRHGHRVLAAIIG